MVVALNSRSGSKRGGGRGASSRDINLQEKVPSFLKEEVEEEKDI